MTSQFSISSAVRTNRTAPNSLFGYQRSPQTSPEMEQRKRKKVENAWNQKRLSLLDNKITINGTKYAVSLLNSGTYHKVYEFVDGGSIEIEGQILAIQSLVLKVFNRTNVAPDQRVPMVKGEDAGYSNLIEEKVPVALMYADPIRFEDSFDSKNGLFWLVEKMDQRVTGNEWAGDVKFDELDDESQKVLTWAKGWLTKMATEKRDIINDFRRRNTMMKNGELKVIDFSRPEDDEWDIKYGIYRYTVDWANGNEKILNWLISDYDEEMKLGTLSSFAVHGKTKS